MKNNLKKFLTSISDKINNNIYGIFALIILLSIIFVYVNSLNPHRSELSFVEYSMNDKSKGSVVPASCNNNPPDNHNSSYNCSCPTGQHVTSSFETGVTCDWDIIKCLNGWQSVTYNNQNQCQVCPLSVPVVAYLDNFKNYSSSNSKSPNNSDFSIIYKILNIEVANAGGGPSGPINISPTTAPIGVNASLSQDKSRIDLTWNPITNDPNGAVTSYYIYKNGNYVTSVTGTSYTDSNVLLNDSNYYDVAGYIFNVGPMARSNVIVVSPINQWVKSGNVYVCQPLNRALNVFVK